MKGTKQPDRGHGMKVEGKPELRKKSVIIDICEAKAMNVPIISFCYK
jgi:hypothetical protein